MYSATELVLHSPCLPSSTFIVGTGGYHDAFDTCSRPIPHRIRPSCRKIRTKIVVNRLKMRRNKNFWKHAINQTHNFQTIETRSVFAKHLNCQAICGFSTFASLPQWPGTTIFFHFKSALVRNFPVRLIALALEFRCVLQLQL